MGIYGSRAAGSLTGALCDADIAGNGLTHYITTEASIFVIIAIKITVLTVVLSYYGI